MTDVKKITIPVPDNWHCHLREGSLLQFMVPTLIENGFRGRVLAMPNLIDPNLTGQMARDYESKIYAAMDVLRLSLLDQRSFRGFTPVVTIQITENTTPAMIFEARKLGVRAAKVYPRDVTTNSANGVVDYENIYPALKAAEACGMVVCFHAEHPSHNIEGMKKEEVFIIILSKILDECPMLKIVVEHVSSAKMIYWLLNAPTNVGATLTPQHMVLSIDDVVGYNPRSGFLAEVHHIWKPTLKLWEDRQAIQWAAAISEDKRFFYGADDAAHFRFHKEAAKCKCGGFNTTVGLPVTISVFEKHKALHRLPDFVSGFGADFYGVPRNTDTITYEKVPWQVPLEYIVHGTSKTVLSNPIPPAGSVVSMLAGEWIDWKLAA